MSEEQPARGEQMVIVPSEKGASRRSSVTVTRTCLHGEDGTAE
jgi:hypothetical protein